MPSVLQSVLRKVYLSGSNLANTGEDVTPFFNLLNNSINYDFQPINEIGFL